MYCPHCGAALSESASFCRACGGEQIRQDIANSAANADSVYRKGEGVKPVFCRHCGTHLEAGAGFCSNCGAKFTAQTAASQPSKACATLCNITTICFRCKCPLLK